MQELELQPAKLSKKDSVEIYGHKHGKFWLTYEPAWHNSDILLSLTSYIKKIFRSFSLIDFLLLQQFNKASS
jgi:hypothetical protein